MQNEEINQRIFEWRQDSISRELLDFCKQRKSLYEKRVLESAILDKDNDALMREYMYTVGALQVLNSILNMNFIGEHYEETDSV